MVGDDTSRDIEGRSPSFLLLLRADVLPPEYIESVSFSDGGVSKSGVSKSSRGMSCGGRLGNDLLSPFDVATGVRLDFLFFRRRAMRLS
jgi:hypothetical protein